MLTIADKSILLGFETAEHEDPGPRKLIDGSLRRQTHVRSFRCTKRNSREPGERSSRASARETRRAARSIKRPPSRIVKTTDRSLPARDLREKRGERGRPIPPIFESNTKSKSPLSDSDLRRSERIRERYRKALISAQMPPY